MIASGYPEFRQHESEHAVFIGRVADVKDKLRNDGTAPEVLHLATRTLMEWLDVHIRRTDRKLGEYLKGQT